METKNNPVNPENAANAAQEPVMEPVKKINKKSIIVSSVVVAVIAIIVIAVIAINVHASHKADEAIALADTEYNDSIRLERYMDAAKLGHKSGNRAKLEAAIALYKKGDYQAAIKYLDDASVSSDIVGAGKYALMGDCYVNLEDYNKALDCYKKAISEADGNPQIISFVLVKEANIYHAQGNYKAEAEAYETIFNKYPEYAQNLNFDIRKYAERARAAAASK